MPRKENLHNFKNKLLYMDGYKSLKMSQMYDALKLTSKPEVKLSSEQKARLKNMKRRSVGPVSDYATQTQSSIMNTRQSASSSPLATEAKEVEQTRLTQSNITFAADNFSLPDLTEPKPPNLLFRSDYKLPPLKSSMINLDPSIRVYKQDVKNFTSNATVN